MNIEADAFTKLNKKRLYGMFLFQISSKCDAKEENQLKFSLWGSLLWTEVYNDNITWKL